MSTQRGTQHQICSPGDEVQNPGAAAPLVWSFQGGPGGNRNPPGISFWTGCGPFFFLKEKLDENEILKEKFNYNYKIILCENCSSYCRNYKSEIYGKMYDVVDPWGFYHKAFDIRNINDEILEKCVPWYAISTIKLMREANSDEERLRLLNKIGF